MAISRAASQAEAAQRQAKEEELRKRAARQAAAKLQTDVEPDPVVECLVLPMGDGKISMGEHIPPFGTAHYDEGETFSVALPVAIALYDRGYVNFPDAKQASADARAERARVAAEIREAARRAAEESQLA